MNTPNNKPIFYAVPEAIRLESGPSVRVTNFSIAFQELGYDNVIKGTPWSKFMGAIKSPSGDLLYVESSTNRMKLIDLFCLLVLKMKTRTCIVFIRDIYSEVFPEEYESVRSRITKAFNKLSNYIYSHISDRMAFPTTTMGEQFFAFNPRFISRPIIPLAPGTTNTLQSRAPLEKLSESRLEKVKLIYVGAISYKFSGIQSYLRLAKEFGSKFKFYIVTTDPNIFDLIAEYGLQKDQVIVKRLNSSQLKDFIIDEGITFAIHSRPRNVYDDMTYPIKVMDYISWQLPFFTLDHVPIVDLLGKDYPLYCNLTNLNEFDKLISNFINSDSYQSLLNIMQHKRNQNSYTERVKYLLRVAKTD